MAYILTAIMSGGVAAILSLFAGEAWGQIFLNYVIYGHVGIVVLAVAQVLAGIIDRRLDTQD
ncbi:hypothetical protein K3757_10415 [Sulfitobacter sp. S223]|uniref:hypothetical protein n=1 Tax=Sulfitobacter sp. S223 TaxID=2867023 RepID=UPI0021A77CBD|nr:hypothetical protein [Sulfitobacter sp. S223]UWR24897.1 hypothetical protein K3757_10415 [Sulfitobacter sp. S223]